MAIILRCTFDVPPPMVSLTLQMYSLRNLPLSGAHLESSVS